MDTIPIEDFAKYVKSSFVSHFTEILYQALTVWLIAIPYVGPAVKASLDFGLGWFVRTLIEFMVTFIATKGGLVAFVINSGVFTTSQAKDYLDSIEKLHNLPDNVSDADWEKAENEANHHFGNVFNWTK